MKHYLQFTKQLFLLITPLLASSMLATSPSRAASFASSKGQFEFKDFSQSPLRVLTNAEANTLTTGQSSIAIADAQAYAFFLQRFPAQAFNFSSSVAYGENKAYLAEADSEASVLGTFDVKADTDFSFDFAGNLDLLTLIDNPSFENAIASGNITFALYDTANNDILEFFSLSGNLTTESDNDFIAYQTSDNVTLTDPLVESDFEGKEKSTTAFVEGNLKRTFASPINLALIEVRRNQAEVSTTVPEPSTGIALLLSCGFVGVVLKPKRK